MYPHSNIYKANCLPRLVRKVTRPGWRRMPTACPLRTCYPMRDTTGTAFTAMVSQALAVQHSYPQSMTSIKYLCFLAGGEVVLCRDCHRVYHQSCIKQELCDNTGFICSFCRSFQVDEV